MQSASHTVLPIDLDPNRGAEDEGGNFKKRTRKQYKATEKVNTLYPQWQAFIWEDMPFAVAVMTDIRIYLNPQIKTVLVGVLSAF